MVTAIDKRIACAAEAPTRHKEEPISNNPLTRVTNTNNSPDSEKTVEEADALMAVRRTPEPESTFNEESNRGKRRFSYEGNEQIS